MKSLGKINAYISWKFLVMDD